MSQYSCLSPQRSPCLSLPFHVLTHWPTQLPMLPDLPPQVQSLDRGDHGQSYTNSMSAWGQGYTCPFCLSCEVPPKSSPTILSQGMKREHDGRSIKRCFRNSFMEQWAKHMIFKKKVSRWTVNFIFNFSEVPWGTEWWCFGFCRKWSFFLLDLRELGNAINMAEIRVFQYKMKLSFTPWGQEEKEPLSLF